MHTEELKEIKSTQITHIFKYGNCDKDLGTSVEKEDGYYETYGGHDLLKDLMHNFTMSDNICLCDKCYNKLVSEIEVGIDKIIQKY